MDKKNCLILDQKSWHYKLNKFVWGKNWDTKMDFDGFRDAVFDWDKRETLSVMNPELEAPTLKSMPTYESFRKDIPLNLCPYMRRVFASIIFLPAVIIGKALLRVPAPTINFPRIHLSGEKQNKITQSVVSLILLGVGMYWFLTDPTILLAAIIIFAGILTGIGIFLGAIKLHKKTKPWRQRHHVNTPNYINARAPKLTGLRASIAFFNAYLHARHKKVCPCLERVK